MYSVFLSDKDSSSWIKKYYSVAVYHWKPVFLFHVILGVPWTEKQNARKNLYSRYTNKVLKQDPLTLCLVHVFPSRSHQDTSSKAIWNCYEEGTAAASLSYQGQHLCFPGYPESQIQSVSFCGLGVRPRISVVTWQRNMTGYDYLNIESDFWGSCLSEIIAFLLNLTLHVEIK